MSGVPIPAVTAARTDVTSVMTERYAQYRRVYPALREIYREGD